MIDSDEDDAGEVVFAEEQEYGNDEDDFGAVNDDDDWHFKTHKIYR